MIPKLEEPVVVGEDYGLQTNYPVIEIRLQLTGTAFRKCFQPNNVQINYLHIDADHHYGSGKPAWDLCSSLVPKHGIITRHVTVNYREPRGVYLLMVEIREQGKYEVINLPIQYGTTTLRKHQRDSRPSL